jgi:hypothetical protein
MTILADAPARTNSKAATLAEITRNLKANNAAGVASRKAREAADAAAAKARPKPESTGPVKMLATEWATRICGKLWSVATADQRAQAVALLNQNYIGGMTIEPAGPSLRELEALLVAAKAEIPAPVVEPCEECGSVHDDEESDPSTWPSWTDEHTWTLAEDRHPSPNPAPKPKPQPPKGPRPQPVPAARPFGEGVLDDEPEASFADALVVAVAEADPDLGFSLHDVLAFDHEADDTPAADSEPFNPDRLRLDAWVDAEASRYAAMDHAAGDLIAKTLADLARSIRFTGARSVAVFEDRWASIEADREYSAWKTAEDHGRLCAMAEAGR